MSDSFAAMQTSPIALAVLAALAAAIGATPFAVSAQGTTARRSATGSAASRRLAHPLDPLSSAEIGAAVRVLKAGAQFPEGALFPIVVLNEPPKAEVLAFTQGAPSRREAFAVIYDRTTNKTFEAVADLKTATVQSWKEMPGVQPGFLVEELTSAPEIVKADSRWQAAMRRRGYTDFTKIQVDGWAPGTYGVTNADGPRLIRAIAFDRTNATSNVYSRPIEGVEVVVDMNQRRVIEFNDREAVPVSPEAGQLDARSNAPMRAALRPLRITQPMGPDFQVLGNEIRWQKWRFRYALHPREGLVLYTVGYEDGGKVRPILYRASLSEMVVPYGDADKAWAWRNAFDVGEYGIGRLASRLIPGSDAPGNATYLDAAFADDFGKAYTANGVVTAYERDGGLLWKHFDVNLARGESRRGRELVIGYLAAVGNYDYGINWIFRQDGSLELQADLTGILLTKGVNLKARTDDGAPHGMEGMHLVAPYVSAPHHQHFFNFRLDFDLEDVSNSVHETELVPEDPVPGNPERNAFVLNQRLLRSEREAQRDLDHRSHRTWKVLNPNPKRKTALGHFPAYELMPGTNAAPFAHPDSLVRKRAGFVGHHLWVTRHKPGESYAAGDYPNQSGGGDGLPRYAADNESLVGQDVVLWYTMGLSHAARAEEWPVMPVARASFRLVPHNFFDRNPALDVPKP